MAEREAEKVRYWYPDQAEGLHVVAKCDAQTEIINHLKCVGLHLTPPMINGANYQVIQEREENAAAEHLFSASPPEINVNFTTAENTRGYVVACFDAGTKLEIFPINDAGTVKMMHDRPARCASKNFTSENQNEFTLGDIYAGAGFFTDPTCKDVGPARMFLTPLSGFAITVAFHPTENDLCLGNTRRMARIIHYRIDGLFSTTFSTSWQARNVFERLFPDVCSNVCSTVCSSVAQTLRSWRRTKLITAGDKHDGMSMGIPDNNVMPLYPVKLNNDLFSQFTEKIPAAWKKHPIFNRENKEHDVGEWKKACKSQADVSVSQLAWAAVDALQTLKGVENPPSWLEEQMDPMVAQTTFLAHTVCVRNKDLGWLDADSKMPLKSDGELLTQEEWQLAYETETMSLNSADATAKLNWSVLIDEQTRSINTRQPKNTRNETGEGTGASPAKKKQKKKASGHGGGDGDADAGKRPVDVKAAGIFDPNHKSENDAALGALVKRKFCDMKYLDMAQVQMCVDDFINNHATQAGSKVKKAFEKMFESSLFAKSSAAELEALKNKLIENGLLNKDPEPAAAGKKKVPPSKKPPPPPPPPPPPQQQPQADTEGDGPEVPAGPVDQTGADEEDEEVPPVLAVIGAIGTALQAWERKVSPRVVQHDLAAFIKTQFEELKANGVLVPGGVPPVPDGGGLTEAKVEQFIEAAVNKAIGGSSALEKEQQRVTQLRAMLISYIQSEKDVKYVAKMMRRHGPDGRQLFSDQEITQDTTSTYHMEDQEVKAILHTILM